MEALYSGLPILGFDTPPGDERRVCLLLEEWEVGHWVRRPEELAPLIERLLTHPDELERLRGNVRARARPQAAHDAAKAILDLLKEESYIRTRSG